MAGLRGRRRTQASVGPDLDDLAAADGVEVADLLREVSDFRLALDVDLTIAAAAADAAELSEAPAELPIDLTSGALASARLGLASLRDRSAARDAGSLPAPDTAVRRRAARRSAARRSAARRPASQRRRLLTLVPTAPLVVVAVALGLGGGALANHLAETRGGPTNAADSSLATLSSAVGQGNHAAAVAAGHRLQADVAALIGRAGSDPMAARAAATLLVAEGTILAQLPGPDGVSLRAMMATQSGQLQRASGQSVATLATLEPVAGSSTAPGRLSATSVTLPASSPVPLHLTLPHPTLPVVVQTLIPIPALPRPSRPATAPTTTAATATPSATPSAAGSGATAATPSAAPSPTAATPPATPAPAASTGAPATPLPSFGIPTNGYFDNRTAIPGLGD